MKTLQILIILLAVVLNLCASQDREFYLVAKEERLGSVSSYAKEQKGIYLRWDIIKDNFPKDIATFELYRVGSSGDELLTSMPAQVGMSSEAITKMFKNKDAQRDLYRVIESISINNTSECGGANIVNIGQKLGECLWANSFWGVLESRSNFHVAMARYRAYLDATYDKTLSSITYKLIGKNLTNSKSILLGKVDVKLSQTQLALGAVDFKQTRESSCNDNRYALDDFRVALSWQEGGANVSELFVNDIISTGYDLYYATDSTLDDTWAAGVDIRYLAQTVSHDGDGEISLSGSKLKKANIGALIKAPYYELQEYLNKRGFKPGESHYYFLVSKDFTGNYGKTAYAKVVIPDLLPPPAPSNIRVSEEDVESSLDSVNYQATLRFDTVNIANFVKSHKKMKVCSTELIDVNTRVHFVNKDESCDAQNGRIVNFNVAEYLIYRFDNAADASAFEDLDLDGYNDRNELEAQRCNILSFPTSSKKYLVKKVAQIQEKNISFSDRDVLRGKQYWYRVVSVTPSGVSSNMSAPISAYIPKRETLVMPKMSATYKQLEILVQNKSSINQLIAKDSAGVSDRVRFEFREGTFEMLLSGGVVDISTSLKTKQFTTRPNGVVKVTFFKDVDIVLSQYIEVNKLFIFNTINEKGVVKGYKISTMPRFVELHETLKTLISGDNVVGGCVDLEFDAAFIAEYKGKACYKSSLKIGNRRYFLEKDCELKTTKIICNDTLNNELVSVGVSFITDSGVQTPELYVNYVPVSLDSKVPDKPLLENVLFDKASGIVSLTVEPLVEKIPGVMIEVYKQGSSTVYTKLVELLNDDTQSIDTNVTGLTIAEGDTWCIKAKSIGFDNLLSEWSEPICHDIKTSEEIIDSLAWPTITNKVRRVVRDLNASYDFLAQSVTITLAKENIAGTSEVVTEVTQKEYSPVIAHDYVLSNVQNLTIQMVQEGRTKFDRKVLQTFTISKFFDDFLLPKNVINFDETGKTNLLIITMKDKNGISIGESIEIKNTGIIKENGVSVKDRPETTAFIAINSNLTNRACILMPLLDKYTNYVVYRQEVGTNPADSDGNFVQVSPLIERSTCGKDGLSFSKNLFTYSLNNVTRIVKFIDRYPFEIGEKYRYMFLFFDKNGEPQSYSLTNPDAVATH